MRSQCRRNYIFNFSEQIGSMLPCVYSVIDHRWRQNVVRTKKVANEAIAECVTNSLTTFLRLLWSIHWTDARQHGTYLFYTIKKQTTTTFFFFQNLSQLLESRPFPIFGDPGAVSGGGKKSKRARKFGRRKVKNERKRPLGQGLNGPVRNDRSSSGFWLMPIRSPITEQQD